MKRKIVGVQKELNEIAQELTIQGIEVTDMFDTTKDLDAMVYYNDKSDMINTDRLENAIASQNIYKINAAKNNVDKIIQMIKEI